jgi:hypothetical protein
MKTLRQQESSNHLIQHRQTPVIGAKAWMSRKSKEKGPEVIIAPRKDWKQRKRDREKPPPRGRNPNNLWLK